MSLADSSISVVLMPKTPADDERLARGLGAMIAEDARLHSMRDPQTGYTLVSAVDIRHLDMVVDRLARQFRVEAGVGKPTTDGDVGLGPSDERLS
jgi:elongation factor G